MKSKIHDQSIKMSRNEENFEQITQLVGRKQTKESIAWAEEKKGKTN